MNSSGTFPKLPNSAQDLIKYPIYRGGSEKQIKLPFTPGTPLKVEKLPNYIGAPVIDIPDGDLSGSGTWKTGNAGALTKPSAPSSGGSDSLYGEGSALFDIQTELEQREKIIDALEARIKRTNDKKAQDEYNGRVYGYMVDKSEYEERCRKYQDSVKAEKEADARELEALAQAYQEAFESVRADGIENGASVGYNGKQDLAGTYAAQTAAPDSRFTGGLPQLSYGLGTSKTGRETAGGLYTGGTPEVRLLASETGTAAVTSGAEPYSDIAVRDANASQGNRVEWDAGSGKGHSTITITTARGAQATLREGTDYYIGSDEKAYYINNPVNRVKVNGNPVHFESTRRDGEIRLYGTTLEKGRDYYIGKDGYAYYYDNVRSKNESRGYDVSFELRTPGESRITVALPFDEESVLTEGKDYYIGSDEQAHYFNGPPSTGKTEVIAESSPSGPFAVDTAALVAMAESQVGYTEKNNREYEDDPVSDTSHAGSDNYNKYGAYYKNDGDVWCAYFVSWCLQQDNSDTSVQSGSTGAIMKMYENEGCFQENDYSTPPHAGDIVIFKKPGEADPSLEDDPALHYHIGIVVAYDPESNMVYTVEGNSGDKVAYRAYDLADFYDPYVNNSDDKFMRGFCKNGGTSYGTVTDAMRKATGTNKTV